MPVCLLRSDTILSPVSLAFSVCQWLCVSLSLCLPVCVGLCACVCAHVSVSHLRSSSLSLNLHLFLALCLLILGLPPFLWPWPLTGAMTLALADEFELALCLTWPGCVQVSVCLSVCLPVTCLPSQEGPVLGGRCGELRASVGRRGGADTLWWTRLVAPHTFLHWAGARQDGHSRPWLCCI